MTKFFSVTFSLIKGIKARVHSYSQREVGRYIKFMYVNDFIELKWINFIAVFIGCTVRKE